MESPRTPYVIDPTPYAIRMVDPPYGTFFYSIVGAVAAKACSDSTVRSIVKPQHVILLHLLLKTHSKHPLQDALINPKKVIINVLFSDTKSLKLHITIVYVTYFVNEVTSLFSRAVAL